MKDTQRLDYASLKENKTIQSLYCSSQCCASGTCDNAPARRVRDLSRNQKSNRKLILDLMTFERTRVG